MILNPEYIRRANAQSHFDAGDSIDRDAQIRIAAFDADFKADGLTEEQAAYLNQRREEWCKFVLEYYNDYCRRRAEYVPVSVCGPARYPAAKMEKRVEKIMSLHGEFQEKAGRFFNNTQKRLKELLPPERELELIRAGKWSYGETIPATDPLIVEKLEAKATHLESTLYKGMPAYARQNARANIKRTRDRIAQIKAERETPTIQGWSFDGGEAIANQEEDRLQIIFNDRPAPKIIARLKGEAFRWSPRNKAWQRQLTRNAVYAAKRVLEMTNV